MKISELMAILHNYGQTQGDLDVCMLREEAETVTERFCVALIGAARKDGEEPFLVLESFAYEDESEVPDVKPVDEKLQ